MAKKTKYVTESILANELGLPISWIKEEAISRRIPVLLVSGRRYYDREAVEEAIERQARHGPIDPDKSVILIFPADDSQWHESGLWPGARIFDAETKEPIDAEKVFVDMRVNAENLALLFFANGMSVEKLYTAKEYDAETKP